MKMISPEIQAQILVLHFGEGVGTRAIARQLGVRGACRPRDHWGRELRAFPEKQSSPLGM